MISFNVCRSRDASLHSKARSPSSTSITLDDIAYVSKDRAETSVLFELIGSRYERRSLLITANQPFGEWGKILSRSSHDARRHRSSRPSLDHPRNERRELSTPCRT
jgi:DNA replication protein DnaC